jgi:hypothetical protein
MSSTTLALDPEYSLLTASTVRHRHLLGVERESPCQRTHTHEDHPTASDSISETCSSSDKGTWKRHTTRSKLKPIKWRFNTDVASAKRPSTNADTHNDNNYYRRILGEHNDGHRDG